LICTAGIGKQITGTYTKAIVTYCMNGISHRVVTFIIVFAIIRASVILGKFLIASLFFTAYRGIICEEKSILYNSLT